MHNCLYLIIQSEKTIAHTDIKTYKQTSVGVSKFINADSYSLYVQRSKFYSLPNIALFKAT